MLIPISKKLLKSINYLCESDETTDTLSIAVYFHNRIKDLDLLNTIEYLFQEGYITGDNRDLYWENIKPTYKGKHYNNFEWVKLKAFLFKSVAVPIFVSIATTLVLNWLNKM
jgi:hypothetical protein